MPRRQRFKPSRKSKPAIEPSELENVIIQPTVAKAPVEQRDRPPQDDHAPS